MYGEHVTVSIKGLEITVFVFCTPGTSQKELQKKAKRLIAVP